MKRALRTITLVAASTVLVAFAAWAASYTYGAAHNYASPSQGAIPFPARFREEKGYGLMVTTWVNGAGPYRFAIDTGAGSTILSERIAREARVGIKQGSAVTIRGLSGIGNVSGRDAILRDLAIGERDNLLPARGAVIVTAGLPQNVDGVLDPVESYWPLGFVIDLPLGEISAFDPRAKPLRLGDVPTGGAVVPWIFTGGSRRPFVKLTGGQRALVDTGSGFGLAVSVESAISLGIISRDGRERNERRDLGGGRVTAVRVAPVTVRISTLELRRVPTDLLYGAAPGSPILLGRDALSPFRLTFDPLHKLIQIAPR